MRINVGVINNKKIEFSLTDNFILNQNNSTIKGNFIAELSNGAILFNNSYFNELYFKNISATTFLLNNVVIGKDFHWQQVRDLRFEGDLKIIVENDVLIAVNVVDLERYLYSVIASEMSSTSFLELLKAHAVISRSWIVSAINSISKPVNYIEYLGQEQFIKWYERDAHTSFDVCADDHCQRYHGVPDCESVALKEAIEQTAGQVLAYNGIVCDARFSKCCGGFTERFSSCWADIDYDYLVSKADSEHIMSTKISNEQKAQEFISSFPNVFCNTSDNNIINHVFNDYDQKTQEFFRWKVYYTQEELSEIIKVRSGMDFGKILNLYPLKRTSSGRITLLQIEGEKHSVKIGKELEIRRWLSRTHLYSSFFVIERDSKRGFIFKGAGWGHGVGLCQIGAAVMAYKGYSYRQILKHYYPNTKLQQIV